MNKSIRTLAASAALVALTIGPAMAQNTKPAATTETKTKTESKTKSTTKTSAEHHASMTKDQYKAAQEGLAKGGYFKGTPNGVWDKASTSALKAWQKANKMPVNGHLTPDVLTKLSA
jgi:peptidoglycan hydrolase-like protein with peptidoglycan-binding domain